MNFYDKDELKKFMAALENNNNFRAFVYFRLLAFTGMRKGESLALKWSDIDLEKQTLYINKAVSRSATGLYIQTPKLLLLFEESQLMTKLCLYYKSTKRVSRWFSLSK